MCYFGPYDYVSLRVGRCIVKLCDVLILSHPNRKTKPSNFMQHSMYYMSAYYYYIHFLGNYAENLKNGKEFKMNLQLSMHHCAQCMFMGLFYSYSQFSGHPYWKRMPYMYHYTLYLSQLCTISATTS